MYGHLAPHTPMRGGCFPRRSTRSACSPCCLPSRSVAHPPRLQGRGLLVQDALGCELRRYQHNRQAGARVRARPHEVKVAVAGMAVAWTQIAHLPEVVAQAKRRPLHQIQFITVAGRVHRLFADYALSKAAKPYIRQAVQYRLPGTITEGSPVLGPLLVEMAYRNQHHQTISLRWSKGRVGTRGRADVEGRL